jgi:hypothetical protein
LRRIHGDRLHTDASAHLTRTIILLPFSYRSEPRNARHQYTTLSTSDISHYLASSVVAEVLDQSANPTFYSCDSLLSDRPAAQQLVSDAIQRLESDGYVTAAQLNAPGVLELVSDDPFNSADEIVTVEVANQNVVPVPDEPGYSIATGPEPAFAVVIDAASGSVVSDGRAPW